jgi:GNAT superfamily N-acetyltransferase
MMCDPAPSFEALRDAHTAALTGSLVDGIDQGPGGAGYVWSRMIPDPTLNFAYGVCRPDQFAWAGAAALARARAPAFLAGDTAELEALRALFTPAALYPASWMVAMTDALPSPAEGSVNVHATSVPPSEFETVFANLSEEAAVKTHLRRYYLPALRSARAQPGLVPIHIVLDDATGPAACASLYLHGDRAGLYNVSTRVDRQRRGLGGKVTIAALQEAQARGATQVFLQCPAGGAIESLYARCGFRTAYAPTLICMREP